MNWLIQNVVDPVIQDNKDWGELNKSSAGMDTKQEFIGDFNSFTRFLERKHSIYSFLVM